MAADKIKVDINEVIKAAKMFSDAVTTCRNIKKDLETVTNNLIDNWYGKSVVAFEKNYLILDRNMDTYSDILGDYAKALIEVANAYKDTDGNIAKALSQAIKDRTDEEEMKKHMDSIS
jgi:WXG100 family type VII secretion target